MADDTYYPKDRFKITEVPGNVKSKYDQPSEQLQDLVGRNEQAVYVQTINLGAAGSAFIPVEGYHFVVYGHDNSANKAVDTTALVNVWIGKRTNDGSNPFPAKHARGFSGPFPYLALEWPAQTDVFVDLIIYKGDHKPWIDGEACT